MKSAIIGLSGPVLTPDEVALLSREQPAGVILFARNIIDPAQVALLMAQLEAVLPPDALRMVDQEGGRVARLKPPHWLRLPPCRALGELHARDAAAGLRAAWLQGALIGAVTGGAGFNLVAAPVLDVAAPDGHDVIGDRAFSADPEAVAALGDAMARGLLAAGVQPVGKHAPGHGRARADSHLELPVLDDIAPADLLPFARNTWLPWLMTAHIRYMAKDELPATQSHAVLYGVIRAMGFAGVLISDDLAMQALSGSPGTRAARALAAGCDIALHCSGVLAETEDVLAHTQPMTGATAARLHAAAALAATARVTLNVAALAAEHAALLA
jgi:beta-N-acetylhexosaminidase